MKGAAEAWKASTLDEKKTYNDRANHQESDNHQKSDSDDDDAAG